MISHVLQANNETLKLFQNLLYSPYRVTGSGVLFSVVTTAHDKVLLYSV